MKKQEDAEPPSPLLDKLSNINNALFALHFQPKHKIEYMAKL